ncbi:MAG: SAM-dependent methyltransferase [Myxococcota bacterium]|jgi:SAM-dependent methyltransferase
MSWLPGVHIAPNIQDDPGLYEIENRALDPDGLLLAAMADLAPWADRVAVDLGAGAGFWVPHLATTARHVFAVEPHGPSRILAMKRLSEAGIANASVLVGSAEQTFLAADSVDVVHARFAYFWGAGCEHGLAEVARILKPGGSLLVIDNDLERGTFAEWLTSLPPPYGRDGAAIDAFWAAAGFSCARVLSRWSFGSREELEAVARLEFREHADRLIAGHVGLDISYGYKVFYRQYS